MRSAEFAPCLPTRGTAVPAGSDWIHEIKHDGYRLTVHREGKRVRLFTRNGHDWSDRYPLIVEAALRMRIPKDAADNHIGCHECGGWIDVSDLGAVVDHSGPLPHPAIDQPQ
jgi:hypothetical protein